MTYIYLVYATWHEECYHYGHFSTFEKAKEYMKHLQRKQKSELRAYHGKKKVFKTERRTIDKRYY